MDCSICILYFGLNFEFILYNSISWFFKKSIVYIYGLSHPERFKLKWKWLHLFWHSIVRVIVVLKQHNPSLLMWTAFLLKNFMLVLQSLLIWSAANLGFYTSRLSRKMPAPKFMQCCLCWLLYHSCINQNLLILLFMIHHSLEMIFYISVLNSVKNCCCQQSITVFQNIQMLA